jgi:hypothetical protein
MWSQTGAVSHRPRPIRHQFRMLAPERLGDVAVPAHRDVRLQRRRNVFRLNVLPKNGPTQWSERRGRTIEHDRARERMPAIETGPSLVPRCEQARNPRLVRRRCDLLDAALVTAGALGPARAGPQAERLPERDGQSATQRRDANGRGFSRFGTRNQARPPVRAPSAPDFISHRRNRVREGCQNRPKSLHRPPFQRAVPPNMTGSQAPRPVGSASCLTSKPVVPRRRPARGRGNPSDRGHPRKLFPRAPPFVARMRSRRGQ